MAMINFVFGKFQFDSIYFPEGDQWKFHARHMKAVAFFLMLPMI